MTEKQIYTKALSIIKENKISDGIDLLKNTESYQNNKLLGILYCIAGKFEKANKIFLELLCVKEDKDIKKYLLFLENEIKDKYIPLYNKVLNKIKNNDSQNIEEGIVELEKISNNIELYSLITLYYLGINNKKKAKEYYDKLKELDSSDIYTVKLEKYFIKNSFKYLFVAAIIGLGAVSIFMFNNMNESKLLKGELEKREVATKSQFEENNILTNKMAILEKQIKKLNSENKELNKEKIELETIFNSGNLYNKFIEETKNENYSVALKILERINVKELPLYKQKEILFQKAEIFEKTGDKEKALAIYKEYLKETEIHKGPYNYYKKIVDKKIENLKKGI